LHTLHLWSNQITQMKFLPKKIIFGMQADISTYCIDSLDADCEILVLNYLSKKIDNLPYNLKQVWIKQNSTISKDDLKYNLKIPFGCELILYN
jgi:hypothetical protein